MRKRPTLEDLIKAAKEVSASLGRSPTKPEFMKATGFSNYSIVMADGMSGILGKAGLKIIGAGGGGENLDPELKDKSALKMAQVKKELERVRSQLAEAQNEALGTNVLKELIHGANSHHFEQADWTKGARRQKSTTGIPVLKLSDIHFDEVVKPEQVDFSNEYNRAIAIRRIEHTFKSAFSLLKYQMVSPKYDGIVIPLNGDMLSGNIHEELAETNEDSILSSLLTLTDLLITGIGTAADEFGKVFVPCTVGNHGRMHRKPRAKNRVKDNFEFLIYHYIARYFKSDSRVTVMIPESADLQYMIYDKTIMQTHGDQFRGGNGVAGLWTAILLGMARKQKRQQGVGKPFDLMIIGHWHTLIMTHNLVVNGSIKGLDEYAYQGNFGFEPPAQALFIMHPDYGMTGRWPIYCDELKAKEIKKPLQVSW